jgi:hypothetical protein
MLSIFLLALLWSSWEGCPGFRPECDIGVSGNVQVHCGSRRALSGTVNAIRILMAGDVPAYSSPSQERTSFSVGESYPNTFCR